MQIFRFIFPRIWHTHTHTHTKVGKSRALCVWVSVKSEWRNVSACG